MTNILIILVTAAIMGMGFKIGIDIYMAIMQKLGLKPTYISLSNVTV